MTSFLLILTMSIHFKYMLCNFWYYKYDVFHICVNRIAGNKNDDDGAFPLHRGGAGT
jgi:hypothetical protein